ncbi:phage tail protein [Pseudomonas sp. 10S4]|uniref:phage tail protein n=1 Tax=Pseudomonas sp. 10S4 TaxID=3048583 RepID=UPI002B22C465|nr:MULTISPECIES: phage tail protein [unclassified Pseudomonas]MEB0223618.1 phage tail protein [Pseudomonas sp. 5S1]MEB0297766.1 phage tail protein [Pseudomonas sp. 10S4]
MADYYTLLTNAGIAYETACKAAGQPIKLSQISVGDGGGAVYNPAATDTALKREVWRGPLNALFQDEKNPSWLLAEVTIPPDVGGWYVREAGLWTDTGILYAIVKYPESFKPVLATSGSGKEFYIRSIFETSNAALVTLLIDDTVVKATRAWVASYVADELAKLDSKQSVRVATTANITLVGPQTIDGVAVVAGDRVLVKNQTAAKDNGIYVAAVAAWVRAIDADISAEVTSALAVSVEQGATQADTRWQLVTDGAIVLGTTALTFQNVTQGFAPLNSPTLLGGPTAPTALQFDSSKLLATTEFVQRAIGSYSGQTNYPGDVVLTVADVGRLSNFAQLSVVTLPIAATVAPGGLVIIGSSISGSVTVKAGGSDTLANLATNPGPFNIPLGSIGVFRRLLGGNGWSFDGGDAALKYSPLMSGANWTTAPQFDNTKTFATTEFVQRALGSYAGQTYYTGDTILTATSVGQLTVMDGPGIVTLPDAATVPVGALVTIVSNAGFTLRPKASVGNTLTTANGVTGLLVFPAQTFAVCRRLIAGGGWTLDSGDGALKYSPMFGAQLGTNGYQKLPTGDIEQWGIYISAPSGSDTVIPLSVAMSVVPTDIQLTFADFSSSQPVGIAPVFQARNSTLGSITVRNLYSANASFFWRVRGKS